VCKFWIANKLLQMLSFSSPVSNPRLRVLNLPTPSSRLSCLGNPIFLATVRESTSFSCEYFFTFFSFLFFPFSFISIFF
jgi:hypothetical protein